jgi:hypothetical protein
MCIVLKRINVVLKFQNHRKESCVLVYLHSLWPTALFTVRTWILRDAWGNLLSNLRRSCFINWPLYPHVHYGEISATCASKFVVRHTGMPSRFQIENVNEYSHRSGQSGVRATRSRRNLIMTRNESTIDCLEHSCLHEQSVNKLPLVGRYWHNMWIVRAVYNFTSPLSGPNIV